MEYDFVIHKERHKRKEVTRFLSLLEEKDIKKNLAELGLKI